LAQVFVLNSMGQSGAKPRKASPAPLIVEEAMSLHPYEAEEPQFQVGDIVYVGEREGKIFQCRPGDRFVIVTWTDSGTQSFPIDLTELSRLPGQGALRLPSDPGRVTPLAEQALFVANPGQLQGSAVQAGLQQEARDISHEHQELIAENEALAQHLAHLHEAIAEEKPPNIVSLVDEENNLVDEIFTASEDGTVRRWGLGGNCLGTFTGHNDSVLSVCVTDHYVFSGSNDTSIRAWDITTGKCVAVYAGHTGGVCSLTFLGSRLFSGSGDDSIREWDTRTRECLRTFSGHKGCVGALVACNSRLYSASSDATVREWEVQSTLCRSVARGHEGPVRALAVCTATNSVFSGGDDKTVREWDMTVGACLRVLQGHTGVVTCLFATSSKVFSGSDDGSTLQWDAFGSKLTSSRVYRSHDKEVLALTVASNRLFTASADGTVHEWKLSSGNRGSSLVGHTDAVYAVGFKRLKRAPITVGDSEF